MAKVASMNATPAEWADFLFDHLQERLQHWEPGVTYRAEDLFGRDDWDCLSSGDQRRIGIEIAQLVRNGQLPLVFVPGKHEYPLHYQLAADMSPLCP